MALIQPNMYGSGLKAADIVQADCSKLKEGSQKIQEAEQNIAESFRIFQESEDGAEQSWEGDTAKRFKVFRQRMDTAVAQALGLSGHLSSQALSFANTTLRIDAEASDKASGEK